METTIRINETAVEVKTGDKLRYYSTIEDFGDISLSVELGAHRIEVGLDKYVTLKKGKE